ncbi:hypothetical protein LOK49_LG04G01294 [Camellia lanceoleosa]|uniref:Uncharacterized protein n=1 Tax=Camellia lanceoleosa TaxID=1840588 RepID=A0ACC0I5J3_9ERIC|nr:hypothetical protein LOK49_LG04G01294 [Camellia lanceoleosa]
MEFKEFLASDDSETGEDENDDAMEDRPEKKHKQQDLYRALLQSSEESDEDYLLYNKELSATYARQVTQKHRKGQEEPVPAQLPYDDKNEYSRSDKLSSEKDKYELSSLVRSIKMKSKQVQIPSKSKLSARSEKLQSKAR